MNQIKVFLIGDMLPYVITLFVSIGLLSIGIILLCKMVKQKRKLQYIRNRYPNAATFYGLPIIINNSDVRVHTKELKITESEWEKLELQIQEEQRCKQVVSQKNARLKRLYPHGWEIIHQKYPNISEEQILAAEQVLALEEQKFYQAQREALLCKEKKVKSNLSTLLEAIADGDVGLAESKMSSLDSEIKDGSSLDQELVNAVNNAKKKFHQQYVEGFLESYETTYVNYSLPEEFIQGEDWSYAVAKFPTKGNIVFPYRRRKIARRGYMENDFQLFLNKNLSAYRVQVIGDCSIHAAEDYRPYEPDIAIIDKENSAIRIDIEIDEPYSAIINKPTHYIGCGDDFRDLNLNNLGWIVVRFSEYQVFSNKAGCTAFIVRLMHAINPNRELPDSFLRRSCVAQEARWTETEARVMACEKAREQYLNHGFGIVSEDQVQVQDIKQTEQEKICAQLVRPLVLVDKDKSYQALVPVENNYAERDSRIQFFPQEHIYVYNGHEQFLPVSSIVASFFKPFDAVYWSAYKANQRRVPQGQILEEWDAKGAFSREVGTFMHKQIENYYRGIPYQQTYPFRYNGKYIHIKDDANIHSEYLQFMSFCATHTFTPYKTEWTIYDENLKIAGTIDMIHYHDGSYDIYDWKRSSRILDSLDTPITINGFGSKGLGKLSHIDDTPYWHYCIQQNIYRYILEKNYKIAVSKMYLVVFGDQRESYVKLEVPRMNEVIHAVEEACKKGVLKDKL